MSRFPLLASLRIAARSLRRRGRTTLLSVGGLAVGVAVCILAGLYVWTQYSYGRVHEDADRIVRIHEENRAYTYDPVWFGLTDAFPGDATAAAFIPRSGVVQTRAERSSSEASRTSARQVDALYYASPSVFDVFTYPLAQGDPATALRDSASAVLSHDLAQALFPNQNPIGRTITVPGDETLRTLSVTGVMEPLPQTMHVRPDLLVPIENLKRPSGDYRAWMYVYVRTAGSTTPDDVVAWLNEQRTARNQQSGQNWGPVQAQPLPDIYLHSSLREELAPTGSFTYVLAFGIVGGLVLVIACINYVLLTTAQVAERMRSVGLRKTFGASRAQVAQHFLAESTLVTGLAVLVGLGMASAAVPGVNRLAPDPISLDWLWSLEGAGLLLGVTLVTILMASAYPATYLSRLQPVRLFRGGATSRGDAALQRGLVVTQFALSIALAVVTLVVVQQTRYMAEKDLGLDREHTLMVNTRPAGSFAEYGVLPVRERRQRLDRIETALRQRADVRATGRMAYRPNSDYVFVKEVQSTDPGGPSVDARLMFGSEGVSRAMGVPMVAGQRLDEAPEGILINRAAAEKLGDAGTVGATVRLRLMRSDTTTVIAGIMENFHYQSLRTQITPAFLAPLPSFRSDDYLFVRAAPGRADAVFEAVQAVWQETMPAGTFDATFLDDEFAQMHRADQQQRTLLLVLAGIALFVACLGLIGLVAYLADRRRAEIGVRKSLGATATSIVGLFTKDVLRWIGIAFLVSVPLAYLAASTWLEQFAYRIDLGPTVFLGAGLLVATVALLAVANQVRHAARIDPAIAMRDE